MKNLKDNEKKFFFKSISLDLQNISFGKLRQSGVLRDLMRDSLIDEYLKDFNIHKENIDIKDINLWCDLNNIKNDKDLEKWKKFNFFDEASFEELVKRDLQWSAWCLERYKNEIETSYLTSDRNIEMVNYSLLRTTNENLANELYLRIFEDEESFENLAEKFSQGDEKYSRGRVGPTHIDNAHPQIKKILKSITPGKVTSPIKIESWWIIIRLNELKKNQFDDFQRLKIALKMGDELIKKKIHDICMTL